MKYIVDRIEGDYAVCESEDRSIVDIPVNILPPEIKEGDNIIWLNDAYHILPVDNKRITHINDLMKKLWN